MNSHISNWIKAKFVAISANEIASSLLRFAEENATPSRLRRAEPSDIVENAIIWYENEDEFSKFRWVFVNEVYKPDDQYKAFCGHDGCRDGLDGAYVEIK